MFGMKGVFQAYEKNPPEFLHPLEKQTVFAHIALLFVVAAADLDHRRNSLHQFQPKSGRRFQAEAGAEFAIVR